MEGVNGISLLHIDQTCLPGSEAEALQLQFQRRHLVRSARLEVALVGQIEAGHGHHGLITFDFC